MKISKVNKAIKDALKRNTHERRNEVFYASEAGYCPRKIYYSFVEHKPMEDLYGIFKLGEQIHEFVQDVFVNSDLYSSVETERVLMIWTPEFNISGRIDIYGIKENGEREVWEIKSRSASYWDIFNEPNACHVAQLQLYLLAERLEKGYLLYVNKNNLDIKVFEVKKDEKLINKLFDKFKIVQEALNKKTPPAETGEKWECKYCPYAVECELYDKKNNEAGKGTKSGDSRKSNGSPSEREKLSGYC